MAAISICNGVTSVGVLNPNMRIFDVVMKTEYGTTYNAYLIQGSEKTALVETVHRDYFDVYRANINEVADIGNIDYLIMNHNEPDHSGSVAELVKLNPNIEILISQAGSIYLKNISNRTDLRIRTVKDGDSIDLGGKTLQFIQAPFLHWPDSMFTWLVEDRVLFSCDFLGSHYCEPYGIDRQVLPQYDAAYFSALKNYYDAIFGPFGPYVQKGLEKIRDLDIAYAATSHGPVLTREKYLPEVLRLYQEWSKPVIRETKLLPVFYCSAYHNTEALANAIVEGIHSVLPDAQAAAYDLNAYDMGEMASYLNQCDGCLIGSPTINRDAVAPVWNLLSHIDAINFAKRPVALFGSYGWSGEAFANLRGRLAGLKANVMEEELKVVFVPTEQDLEKAREFGVKFASQFSAK